MFLRWNKGQWFEMHIAYIGSVLILSRYYYSRCKFIIRFNFNNCVWRPNDNSLLKQEEGQWIREICQKKNNCYQNLCELSPISWVVKWYWHSNHSLKRSFEIMHGPRPGIGFGFCIALGFAMTNTFMVLKYWLHKSKFILTLGEGVGGNFKFINFLILERKVCSFNIGILVPDGNLFIHVTGI